MHTALAGAVLGVPLSAPNASAAAFATAALAAMTGVGALLGWWWGAGRYR